MTKFRIVETGVGGVPVTIDRDGYDTRAAAEAMLEYCGEGCVVEEYEAPSTPR